MYTYTASWTDVTRLRLPVRDLSRHWKQRWQNWASVRLLRFLDAAYAMDRDNRWDRVQKAYDVLTKGEGETAESAVAAMEASYAKDVTDEFFVPTAITENGKPVATIKDKDTVISSTSARIAHVRSQEPSVPMNLTDLTEARERM